MNDLPIGPELRPEDILIESSLADYNHGISFIYMYLQKLNTNVFLVEKILNFPRVFLCENDANGLLQTDFFFRCFVENALEISILTIIRLVQDSSRDVFRITEFQNKLRSSVKPQFQSAYQERLRANRFDQQKREILEKLQTLRNKRIAHLTQEYFQDFRNDRANPTGDLISLFPEIKAICEKLNDCLQNLNLRGGRFGMQLYDLYPYPMTSQPDIEIILDSIAKNSFMLSLPENDPRRWREIMDSRREQLPQYNCYRKKFDMPEVNL